MMAYVWRWLTVTLNTSHSRFGILRSIIGETGFVAFRYPEYRLFWLAAAFSNVGMWALIYGRLWLMHDLTNSPFMVGLTTTANLLPVLLFSVWGGVIADRVNRLRLVRVTRLMFGLVTLLTGGLIAMNIIQPWHILALSVTTGMLLAIDIPSRSAMLPTIVPHNHIASAISLYSLVFGASAILGPATFAPLIKLWGIQGVFFIISAAYLLTVFMLILMDATMHHPERRPTSMVKGLLEGLSYLYRHSTIKRIIILGIIMGIFGSSLQSLMPALADQVLYGGINTYSTLLLAGGIGGLCATIFIAILGTHVRPINFYIVSGISVGLGLMVLSQVNWVLGAILIIGTTSAFSTVFQTMGSTLVQTLSSEEFRGRVMSVHQFTWGAGALGGIIMGTVGEHFGVQSAITIGGITISLAAILVGFSLLRQLPNRRDRP